jgi:hypothetical protein
MRKTCDSSIKTKHPTNGGEKGTRWEGPKSLQNEESSQEGGSCSSFQPYVIFATRALPGVMIKV